MSIFKKMAIQNGVVVVRELDGSESRVVSTVSLPHVSSLVAAKANPPTTAEGLRKATWRTALRKLTNDGDDLLRAMYDIGMGHALTVRLPDGRESDPIVPSAEVRRAALTDLLDRLHGKAVAQTEVVRSEMEAEDYKQYAALTDEQLQAAVEGTKWAIATRKREALSGGTDSGESGD